MDIFINTSMAYSICWLKDILAMFIIFWPSHRKTAESENRGKWGYLVVLKGEENKMKSKPRKLRNAWLKVINVGSDTLGNPIFKKGLQN